MAAACGKEEKPAVQEGDIPGLETLPEGKKENSETVMKAIEDNTVSAIKSVNAKDFVATYDLVSYISGEVMDSDAEAVENALAKILEGMENVESVNTGSRELYRDIYDLSKFTGKFTLKDGKWTASDASNLVFIVNDIDGKPCSLTVNTSGKSQAVAIEDDQTVVVPEHITVVLEDNGKQMMSIKLDTKIDITESVMEIGIAEVNIEDLVKCSLSTTFTYEIAGYVVTVKDLQFENGKAAVSTNIRIAGRNILDIAVAAKDIILTQESQSAGITELYVNLMDAVQLRGSIDYLKFMEMTEAYEDARTEADNKVVAKMFNDAVNLSVYLNMTRTEQAHIEARPVYYKEDEYWDIEPVIVFDDKTSYSMLDIQNRDFSAILNALETVIEGFEHFLPEDSPEPSYQ